MQQAWRILLSTIFALVVLVGATLSAEPAVAEEPTISTRSARFGDSDPVEWQGRAPHRYAVHGIDLSKYQGDVDWRMARRAGVNFAFIKATEGGDRLDEKFRDHWRGARRAGIQTGAYHFYYFCRPASEQAAWFIRNVPRVKGALPPVLDLEWNHLSPTCQKRPPGDEVRKEAKIFLDALHRHYGQRPIIYTTPAFYKDTGMHLMEGEEFWLRSVARTLDKVYPGQRWSFWQYSGTGVVDGIAGDVDLNAFAGGRQAWVKWLAARQQ